MTDGPPRPAAARLLVDPLTRFLRAEAAGGVALLVATFCALLWANTWTDSYTSWWEQVLDAGVLRLDLRHWINDLLMAVFFFVVGLEIKRELVVGELRDRRAAALPVIAALGGVAVPAAIFLAITAGTPQSSGWAIPSATDIAFAVGVLAVLGDSVSAGVKVFLLTIAIVDDIAAILSSRCSTRATCRCRGWPPRSPGWRSSWRCDGPESRRSRRTRCSAPQSGSACTNRESTPRSPAWRSDC